MSEAATATGRLEGKAALVTGASSGLGRATAIVLARAGADVALVARSQQELESAREEALRLGRRALTLPVDLASEVEATWDAGQDPRGQPESHRAPEVWIPVQRGKRRSAHL